MQNCPCTLMSFVIFEISTYSSNIAYVDETGLDCNSSAEGCSGNASNLSVSSFNVTLGKVAKVNWYSIYRFHLN